MDERLLQDACDAAFLLCKILARVEQDAVDTPYEDQTGEYATDAGYLHAWLLNMRDDIRADKR